MSLIIMRIMFKLFAPKDKKGQTVEERADKKAYSK
jgi:hypothetical protein